MNELRNQPTTTFAKIKAAGAAWEAARAAEAAEREWQAQELIRICEEEL